MTQRLSSKTFQDLMTEIKRLFGDESGVQLTDTDIARWGTEAQVVIVRHIGVLKAKSTIAATPGKAAYDFPSLNIQQVASLHVDGRLIPNVPFQQAEQLMTQSPDPSSTGAPQMWYEWGGEFTLVPTPDSPVQITMYYTASPEPLTGNPAQVIGLQDTVYPMIVDYVMMKAYEMDENFQASQLADQRFKDALGSQYGSDREAQDMAYPVIQEVEY